MHNKKIYFYLILVGIAAYVKHNEVELSSVGLLMLICMIMFIKDILVDKREYMTDVSIGGTFNEEALNSISSLYNTTGTLTVPNLKVTGDIVCDRDIVAKNDIRTHNKIIFGPTGDKNIKNGNGDNIDVYNTNVNVAQDFTCNRNARINQGLYFGDTDKHIMNGSDLHLDINNAKLHASTDLRVSGTLTANKILSLSDFGAIIIDGGGPRGGTQFLMEGHGNLVAINSADWVWVMPGYKLRLWNQGHEPRYFIDAAHWEYYNNTDKPVLHRLTDVIVNKDDWYLVERHWNL